MKKIVFMAIAVSMTITGCVKNEKTNGGAAANLKIGFEAPAVSGITRSSNVAGEISTPYPQAEHFSVYALYFDGNYTAFADGNLYMDNAETAYNAGDNTWDTETAGGLAYYWPNNGTLTFGAYSPSGAADDCTVAWGATGFTFTNFTVNTNPALHYDLMFSERSYDRTSSTGGTTYNGVDINFKHALSSVVYKVMATDEYKGHTITVTSIKLVNAYQTGTFNQNLADTDAAVTESAAWSGQDNENTTGYEAVTANQALTTTAVSLNSPNPIIVLPQQLAHAGANNVSLDVTYIIDNGTAEVEQHSTIDISDGYGLTEFEMGKRYIFTLNFGLDKITFSPEVEAWADQAVDTVIEL